MINIHNNQISELLTNLPNDQITLFFLSFLVTVSFFNFSTLINKSFIDLFKKILQNKFKFNIIFTSNLTKKILIVLSDFMTNSSYD